MLARAGCFICEICFWEDDGQDDFAADEAWGGANGDSPLTEWRLEFRALVKQLTETPRLDDALELPLHQALLKLQQLEQRCLAEAETAAFTDLLAQAERVADLFHEWRSPADQR